MKQGVWDAAYAPFFCPGDAIRQTESDRIVRIAPLTPKKEIDSWVKEKL